MRFSIELPAGTKREEKPTEKWINWTFTSANPFMEPQITITVSEPAMSAKDLTKMVKSVTRSSDIPAVVAAKQEQLPDGGFLAIAERTDGQYFRLEVQRSNSDKIVTCSVGQRSGIGQPNDASIPNFAATKAWAEKLCLSLKFNTIKHLRTERGLTQQQFADA